MSSIFMLVVAGFDVIIYITFCEQIFYPSSDGVGWCHSKGLPVCDQESVTGFIDPVGSSLDILF